MISKKLKTVTAKFKGGILFLLWITAALATAENGLAFNGELADFPVSLPEDIGVLSVEDTLKVWPRSVFPTDMTVDPLALKVSLDAVYEEVVQLQQIFGTPLSFDELDGLLMWTLVNSASAPQRPQLAQQMAAGKIKLTESLRQKFWKNLWRREKDAALTDWNLAEDLGIFSSQNYMILKYLKAEQENLPANKIMAAYTARSLDAAKLQKIYRLYGLSLKAPYLHRFQQRGFPLGQVIDDLVAGINKLIYRKPRQRSLYQEELYQYLDDTVNRYFQEDKNALRPTMYMPMAQWRLRFLYLANQVRPGVLAAQFKLYKLPNYDGWVRDHRNRSCPILFLP